METATNLLSETRAAIARWEKQKQRTTCPRLIKQIDKEIEDLKTLIYELQLEYQRQSHGFRPSTDTDSKSDTIP